MTHIEAMKQALDALGAYMGATDKEEDEKAHSLMAAAFFKLKEAIAEAEKQEPYAYTYLGIKADDSQHGPHLCWKPEYMDAMSASKGAVAIPLYTNPQPAAPAIPEGWERRTVIGLDELIDALDYVDRKCFMPDYIKYAWEGFNYMTKEKSKIEPVPAQGTLLPKRECNYKDKDMIEIEYRLKAQEDDVENTLHWHALNYRTALTENAQEMFEALENYVRKKINENNQERKKWVALTDDEIDLLEELYAPPVHPNFVNDADHCLELIRHVEAKLKEKNGYAEEKNT